MLTNIIQTEVYPEDDWSGMNICPAECTEECCVDPWDEPTQPDIQLPVGTLTDEEWWAAFRELSGAE